MDPFAGIQKSQNFAQNKASDRPLKLREIVPQLLHRKFERGTIIENKRDSPLHDPLLCDQFVAIVQSPAPDMNLPYRLLWTLANLEELRET